MVIRKQVFTRVSRRQKGWVGIGVDLKRYIRNIRLILKTHAVCVFFLQGCLVGGVQYVIH